MTVQDRAREGTLTVYAMCETATLLRAQGYGGPIISGGGQISEEVCRYVGADYWTTDGVAGVEMCKKLIVAHDLSDSQDEHREDP